MLKLSSENCINFISLECNSVEDEIYFILLYKIYNDKRKDVFDKLVYNFCIRTQFWAFY